MKQSFPSNRYGLGFLEKYFLRDYISVTVFWGISFFAIAQTLRFSYEIHGEQALFGLFAYLYLFLATKLSFSLEGYKIPQFSDYGCDEILSYLLNNAHFFDPESDIRIREYE